MRRLLLACTFGCAALCGCTWSDKSREVEQTGHGVKLFPEVLSNPRDPRVMDH